MKNKTLATWINLIGGPLGFHRFYLHGWGDMLGWLIPIPTALGLFGIDRIQNYGIDDYLSWILIPIGGFTFAACALRGILYGLMTPEQWNARFNPTAPADAKAGRTNWITILGLTTTLFIGAGVLMASIAFSFQHYFEYQVDEGRKISQPTALLAPDLIAVPPFEAPRAPPLS